MRPIELVDAKRKRVGSAEPARHGGVQAVDQLAPNIQKGDAWHAHEILEITRHEEVDVERLHIHRHRAECLIGVAIQQGSVLVRLLGDPCDVLRCTIEIVAVTRRDDQCVAIDATIVFARVDRSVAHRHPMQVRPAPFLCEPDMTDSRELGFGHDHRASPAGEVECAGDRARGFRHGAEEGDLVSRGTDEAGERDFRQPHLANPRIPIHAALIPRLQIPFRGGASANGLRRLRAVVHWNGGFQEWNLPSICGDVEAGRTGRDRLHPREFTARKRVGKRQLTTRTPITSPTSPAVTGWSRVSQSSAASSVSNNRIGRPASCATLSAR